MEKFPFTIDTESKVKRYYQLYTFFAECIAEGKIPAGEKLPSIRTIAEELNIGRNTVVKAYELLEEEGFIFSYEKSGFFVRDKNATAFIHQNLQRPGEDTVPTVDSIFKQRKGTDLKSGLKELPLSEFTTLIAETSRQQVQNEVQTVSQKELDKLLGEDNRSTTKSDPIKAEQTKKVKESVDEKVASIMKQIQWESEDDESQTLTQTELDAVLNSGAVQTVPIEDTSVPVLDKQLADIMDDIRHEETDDGSQTLSQTELDAVFKSAVVEPEPEVLMQTDMSSAIDLGTEEDFEKENLNMTDADSPFGQEHFRSTLTEFLSLHKRIKCTPKQLVAGANIEELIANTLLTIREVNNAKPKVERPKGLLKLAKLAEAGELHLAQKEQKELIAIPSNGAESLQFLKDVGFEVTELFCDIHGVTPSELESSGASTLVITSTSASAKRRKELLDWVLADESRYIIEYDKEANGAIPALQGEDTSGRVIFAGSASDMLPRFHSCWALLPNSLLDTYEAQFGDEELELSDQEQNKLVEFIESGELDQYLSAREF